jgi:anthranilate phosphoribosyltransferase
MSGSWCLTLLPDNLAMSIAPYLREIGRGKDGARALSREQACDLMSQLLDGQVSDLEKGGFALAMRIKGETPEELAGFMDAVQPRTLALHSDSPAIVLPSYNGARKLPNLVPLLALLLAREGVNVLVHGPLRDPARVTSAQVFDALDLQPVHSAQGVANRWEDRQPAFMPLSALHPSLAALLDLRAVLGLRNPGHSLAKLLPAVPGALRVVNHTHPEYSVSLSAFLALNQATAVLMRGTEGEPVADARRLPALRAFVNGELSEALSVPGQTGSLASVPDLPSDIDPATTARVITDMLAGRLAVPEPITRQVQCLLALRRTLLP